MPSEIGEKAVAVAFLLPGDLVCDWLGIKDGESRFLLRMFVNLSVYGKIAILLLLSIGGDH
ncbi:MAG: hypothetical protein HC850_16095 [Rhodomicrobium sp.]|nr:hypothetical protein [Rhodomicrobium sp.]